MKSETNRKTVKSSLPILLTVAIVMMIMIMAAFLVCRHMMKAENHARYVGMVNYASEKIAKTVRGMEMSAMNEFDEVEKHLDTPESVIAALKSKTGLNPDVRGYFAAFEPHYFEEKGQWFEPYVHHVDSSEFEVRQVGSAHHNYHRSEWYIRAKKSNDSFWSDPYYYYDGTNISGHYTTFVKPVYDAEGRLACVCGADMTFEWLGKELRRIDNAMNDNELINKYIAGDANFYTVVINNDGSCIAHPEGKTLVVDEEFVKRDLAQKRSGMAEIDIDDESAIIYYAPIEHVDWSLALVVTDEGTQGWLSLLGIGLLLVAFAGFVVIWFVCRRMKRNEAI